MKYYHAAPSFIESPTTDFAMEGDGMSVHGFGLYVSTDPSVCEDFIKSDRKGNESGGLFSINIDSMKSYDGYKPSPEDNDALMKELYEKTNLKADIQAIQKDFNNNIDAFSILSKLVPDQNMQNDILKSAGFQAIKKGNTYCIIDNDVLPDSWTYEKTIGQTLNGKPDTIKEGDIVNSTDQTASQYIKSGNFRSEDLTIAYKSLTNGDADLKKEIRKASYILLSGENTKPDSALADRSFAMRCALGRAVNASLSGDMDGYQRQIDIFRTNMNDGYMSQHSVEQLNKILSRIDMITKYDKSIEESMKNDPVEPFQDMVNRVMSGETEQVKEQVMKPFEIVTKYGNKDETRDLYKSMNNVFSQTYNKDYMKNISSYVGDYIKKGEEPKGLIEKIPGAGLLQKICQSMVNNIIRKEDIFLKAETKYGLDFSQNKKRDMSNQLGNSM